MKTFLRALLTLATVALGCGGDDADAGGRIDGGGGEVDAGGGEVDAGGGASVSGVAHVVQGASAPVPMEVTTGTSRATDGTWYASPDQMRITLTRINFAGETPETGTGADLVDCVITYDRATPSLSSLLDCPFAVSPGTYLGMVLAIDTTSEVLISDPENGIFTDPASPTGLSGTEPAGGAAFVPVTTPLGAGFEQYFTTPLVLGPDDSLSISLVVDAIQSARITVSGDGSNLAFGSYFPAFVFPTVGAPGIPQYFTSAGTADTYNDSVVLANIMRVYYQPGGQPAYAVYQQRAGDMALCTDPAHRIDAHPADPAEVQPYNNGDRVGGWLGLDSTDTLCWAYATDGTYQTYANYLTMTRAAQVGDAALIRCEQTATPTPPSSGSTYASGCPAIVNEFATASVTLVAD